MGTVSMGILLGLYLFIVGMHKVLLIEELIRIFVGFLFTYICVRVCTYFKFFIYVCIYIYTVEGKTYIFFKGPIWGDLVLGNERLHLISVFSFGRFRLLWHI